VLRGVARRRTYKQVAHELGISESSVKTYMHRIYEKSGVSNKRQLLARLQGEGRSRQDP
jgi:DNA-binding CsgD family transcriptional regulator